MEQETGGQQAGRRLAGRVLLYASLILNAVLLAHHHFFWLGAGGDDCGSRGLSWALQAAREAEAVAAADCSGHGRVFLDGVAGEDGRPGCECNTCFGGPNCSRRTPNCTADASSGDPLFLEPYWRRHAAASALVFSRWHRMSYLTTDGLFQSVELENHIRMLHRAVGNAVVDEKHLTVMFDGREYEWGGTTLDWANASRNSSTDGGFIEFVTLPNNPDTQLRKPVLGGSTAVFRPRLLLAALHAHPGAGRRGHHDVHHDQALRACWQQIRHGVDQGSEGGQEDIRVCAEQHHGCVPGHPAADAGDHQGHAGQPPRRGRHLRFWARPDEKKVAQAERCRVTVPSNLTAEDSTAILHVLQENQGAVAGLRMGVSVRGRKTRTAMRHC